MATVSHPEPRVRIPVREMWPSLAISVMWVVVLLDALFGPDFVSSTAGGYTRIPSAVFIAFFAWLGTLVLARHGFDRRRRDAD